MTRVDEMKLFVMMLIILGISGIPQLSRAEEMTLETCFERALEHNENLKAARLEIQAREHDSKSVRSHFLPVLRAEANALFWDSGNRYSFDVSGFQQLFDGFAGQLGFSPAPQVPPMEVQVREDITIDTTVMLIQPLTQLVQLAYGFKATEQMAQAARAEGLTERHHLELEVVKSFFANLSAKEMLLSVEQAQKQVEAYIEQTQNYLESGLVEKDAMLKIQVQAAELKQARLQAEKGVRLTTAMLNMLMGRPLDADLSLYCARCKNPSLQLEETLDSQQRAAVENRPELMNARYQATAAQHARSVAIGEMLPEINLVAAYKNNYGMGDLMQENEFFGGVMLTWNVWDWGAGYHKVKAAELRRDRAQAKIRAAEDGIRLEVEQKRLDLKNANALYEVAMSKLLLAEENLRLETNRYAAQQTTTTDLLSAQTAELRARNDVTVAAMTIEVARRDLMKTQGMDLFEDETK